MIHNDLGLRANDKARIKRELSKQGVKAARVELHGDDNEQQTNQRAEAAVKFQAAFRGHKGREHAERETQKKNAEALRRAQEEAEKARTQKKTVYRPKMRSAYGF